MQDAAASAPLPIELVVACLLSQGPSQATTARHSGQWLAVSAMVWSYRLPVLIAGNGSKFQVPGPGGDSETANGKKNQERNASTQVSQTLPKQKVGDSAVRYRTLRTNRYQGNQGSIIEMRSRPPNTTTTTMMPRAATYAMRRHAGADMSWHQYCVGEPPRPGSHQQPRRAVDPQCLGPWTFSSHDPLSPTAPPYRFLASYDTIPRNLCRRNAPP